MSRNIISYYESTQLFLDCFERSPQKVKQLLMIPLVKDKIFPICWDDESIKSPIEQIFILAFELYCKYENKRGIYLFPQSEVICNNKKYYIDFEFKADDYLSYLVFRR